MRKNYNVFLNQDTKLKERTIKFDLMPFVKKALCENRIKLSIHAHEYMFQRGYTLKDIEACIWTGIQTEFQRHRTKYKMLVEGFDKDRNPICIVLGLYESDCCLTEQQVINVLKRESLTVVTVFPPIDKKFIRTVC